MSWKQQEGSIVQLKKTQRINREINASEVRLIGPENEQIGIVPITRALQMAEEAGLDLVETSAMAKPPVCKIVDYGKFRYQETKRAHQAKQKQKQIQIKEVKFRLTTDDNDYQTKLRNLMRFLEEGDKAKVSLRFRGREIARSDLGMQVLNRVSADLKLCGVVEQFPKQEGKQIVMLIAPLKKA